MKRKKKFAIFIVLIFISSIGSYYYLSSVLPDNPTPDNNDDNVNNSNGNNIVDYNFKPPSGIKRIPKLDYQEGSNPSEQKPWPMFQQDIQHTSYLKASGDGDINNYGLLYHRWQDAYSQPVIADFDNDGKFEILTYSEGDQDNQTTRWYYQGIKLHSFNGEVLWTFTDYIGDVWSSPAIADINKDNELEIIVPLRSAQSIIALDRYGNLLWQFNVSGYVESSPAIADINRDGNMEIVFGTSDYSGGTNDMVYALSVDANKVQVLWEYNTRSAVLSSPALIDIDNDGDLEAIFGTYDGHLYALKGNGDILWNFFTKDHINVGDDTMVLIYAAPTVADLDDDGNYEIFIQSYSYPFRPETNYFFLISNNGELILKYQTPRECATSASVADLDSDGWFEIIVGTFGGDLYAFKPNREILWHVIVNEPIQSSPTIVDIDGDGSIEIIVVSSTRIEGITNCNITVLDNMGNQLWRYPLEGSSWTNVPIVDLNGDGKMELVAGIYESFPPGQNDIEHRQRAKTGLYVFGDLSSDDLIDTLPDVAVKDPMIEVDPSQPGQTTIKVTVANAGLVEASQVEVEVRNNLITIGSAVIDSIPPLEQREVEITWAGHASGYTAVIDPDNKITEGDEENNQATKSIS